MATGWHGGQFGDPVHGIMEFTPLERRIIDHPVTQRLRHISQTGLVQYVYPEACTSRFSHSLGTMHLASRLFVASLRNSERAVTDRLVIALKQLLTEAAGKFRMTKNDHRWVEHPALLSSGICAVELQSGQKGISVAYRVDLYFTEQALRLAALFHDLGHLPFSHDFEDALEDLAYELFEETLDLPEEALDKESPLYKILAQRKGDDKLHEHIGHQLAPLVLDDLEEQIDADPDVDRARYPARVVFNLAESILRTNPKLQKPATDAAAALSWLHSIIDGEVDADRCDYLLRDARNYAFTFANYDLPRLLDNLTIINGTGVNDGAFITAVSEKGISSLESFLLSRFRSYQYSVQHPKVAQVGIALRHVIVELFKMNKDKTDLKQAIADLADIVDNSDSSRLKTDPDARVDLLERFATYDDMWWMTYMRSHRNELRKELKKLAERGLAPKDEWLDLQQWLDLVCWRTADPLSLWKRRGDFPEVVYGERRPLATFNSKLPKKKQDTAYQSWKAAEKELRKKGVLVLLRKFVPWKAVERTTGDEGTDENVGESQLMVVRGEASPRPVPVSLMSPTVKALQETWRNDVQVRAFKRSTSPLTKEEVIASLWDAVEQGAEAEAEERGEIE